MVINYLIAMFSQIKAEWAGQGPVKTEVFIKGHEIILVYTVKYTNEVKFLLDEMKAGGIFETSLGKANAVMIEKFTPILQGNFGDVHIISLTSVFSEDYSRQVVTMVLDKDVEQIIIQGIKNNRIK
jgi:hypothetical protein